MYVVCVPHPQPHLDVMGVKPIKLRRLLYSFSSVIGREKKGRRVSTFVNHILMPSSTNKEVS